MPPAVIAAHRVRRISTSSTNDLLTTEQTAAWLEISTQWLEIGRHRGYGPPFIKIGDRGRVRYRRSNVIAWLEERTHHCTAEYQQRNASVDVPGIRCKRDPKAGGHG